MRPQVQWIRRRNTTDSAQHAVCEVVINFINTRAKLNTGYRSYFWNLPWRRNQNIAPKLGCCSRVIPYHNTDDLANLPISAVLRPSLSVSLQHFKNESGRSKSVVGMVMTLRTGRSRVWIPEGVKDFSLNRPDRLWGQPSFVIDG